MYCKQYCKQIYIVQFIEQFIIAETIYLYCVFITEVPLYPLKKKKKKKKNKFLCIMNFKTGEISTTL